MINKKSQGYRRWVHPEEIIAAVFKTEPGAKGVNYLFECLKCGGKASFLPEIRSGHCFVCECRYYLHSKYNNLPEEEIVDLFDSGVEPSIRKQRKSSSSSTSTPA